MKTPDKPCIVRIKGKMLGSVEVPTAYGYNTRKVDLSEPCVEFEWYVTERGGLSENKLDARIFTTPGRAKGAVTARVKPQFRHNEQACRDYVQGGGPYDHPNNHKWITEMYIEEVFDFLTGNPLKLV